MSKFLIGFVVVFIVLFIGLSISDSLRTPSAHVYEDPLMTRINACTQKYERIIQPSDDGGKTEIMWWCARHLANSAR